MRAPNHREVSYWERETLLAPYDCVIVGAGLTGLHIALQYHEKYKHSRIAILERSPFSSGASTRNAGFACFGNVSEIRDDLLTMNNDEVYALMDKRFRGLKRTREVVGDQPIDYQECGSYEILNEVIHQDLLNFIPEANQNMEKYLGLKKVFQFSKETHGFKNATGTIYNPYEGQLHTGKLYQALRALVQNRCIEIFGGCKVTHWETTPSGIDVCLKNGMQLNAGTLILATNAFTPSLLSGEDIVPARGQVVLTHKIPGLNLKGIFFYDKGFYYWRNLDGRVLLGGARNLDLEGETTENFGAHHPIRNHLKDFLEKHILGHPVEIEMEWSGIMAMGSQKNPIIRKVEPQVYLAARMGGMGVALSAVVAEELVEMM